MPRPTLSCPDSPSGLGAPESVFFMRTLGGTQHAVWTVDWVLHCGPARQGVGTPQSGQLHQLKSSSPRGALCGLRDPEQVTECVRGKSQSLEHPRSLVTQSCPTLL